MVPQPDQTKQTRQTDQTDRPTLRHAWSHNMEGKKPVNGHSVEGPSIQSSPKELKETTRHGMAEKRPAWHGDGKSK